NRISPEAPVPIVKVDTNSIEERPGGAANVAMNIAALGASCYVIGLTGVDLAANILKEKLKQAKVVCQCIELPHH
ncbi:MAG: PfkB family carbohydrate kinase, partial [Candidatus Regiella insecticola]|nr:PfkB family carbohydrate kinase [Candidatus Regiella insecticola]